MKRALVRRANASGTVEITIVLDNAPPLILIEPTHLSITSHGEVKS